MREYIKSNPYFLLMRMHSLTGVWLLFWPCLWGVLLGSANVWQLAFIPVFLLGSLVMRSAGCIINDIVDIELDRKVGRTMFRPLAKSDLGILQAMLLLLILLIIGFGLLLIMGKLSFVLSIIAMSVAIFYPFAKYYIRVPQLILGLIFNSGVLIGWAAVQTDIVLTPVLMYIGGFFWIMYYDTIYAHQDKKYDNTAGVNSAALTQFGSKKWLRKFYQLATIFWAFAGILSKVNLLYYITLTVIYYLLFKQLKNIDLNNENDCMVAFRFNAKIGLILSIGIFVGKVHEFI